MDGTLLCHLATDVLKEICYYLSIEDVAALHGTNSTNMKNALYRPDCLTSLTLSGYSRSLASHMRFLTHLTSLKRLKVAEEAGESDEVDDCFLDLLCPTSITSIDISGPLATNTSDTGEQTIYPFTERFTNLKNLRLDSPSVYFAACPLSSLGGQLERLDCNNPFTASAVKHLPKTLASLSLPKLVVNEGSFRSLLDRLAEWLPALKQVTLACPSLGHTNVLKEPDQGPWNVPFESLSFVFDDADLTQLPPRLVGNTLSSLGLLCAPYPVIEPPTLLSGLPSSVETVKIAAIDPDFTEASFHCIALKRPMFGTLPPSNLTSLSVASFSGHPSNFGPLPPTLLKLVIQDGSSLSGAGVLITLPPRLEVFEVYSLSPEPFAQHLPAAPSYSRFPASLTTLRLEQYLSPQQLFTVLPARITLKSLAFWASHHHWNETRLAMLLEQAPDTILRLDGHVALSTPVKPQTPFISREWIRSRLPLRRNRYIEVNWTLSDPAKVLTASLKTLVLHRSPDFEWDTYDVLRHLHRLPHLTELDLPDEADSCMDEIAVNLAFFRRLETMKHLRLGPSQPPTLRLATCRDI